MQKDEYHPRLHRGATRTISHTRATSTANMKGPITLASDTQSSQLGCRLLRQQRCFATAESCARKNGGIWTILLVEQPLLRKEISHVVVPESRRRLDCGSRWSWRGRDNQFSCPKPKLLFSTRSRFTSSRDLCTSEARLTDWGFVLQ